jgi:hypothetical protein
MFEAFGSAAPVGYTVRNDPAVDAVTVTFMMTADAEAGTPATPVTVSGRGAPAASAAFQPPVVVRESRTRVGTTGWKPPPPVRPGMVMRRMSELPSGTSMLPALSQRSWPTPFRRARRADPPSPSGRFGPPPAKVLM